MQDFKRLRTWRKAHALYLNIFHVTQRITRVLPSTLKTQILRAADSVVSNVVEGCAASTNKEFARFLSMSIRSSTELEGHLRKARDLGFLAARTHDLLADDTIQVRKMTVVLRRRVLERGD